MLIVPSYKPREYPSSSEISTVRDDEMTILRKERKDSSILIGNSIERMESCNIIATYHKKDSVILIMLYECYLTRYIMDDCARNPMVLHVCSTYLLREETWKTLFLRLCTDSYCRTISENEKRLGSIR